MICAPILDMMHQMGETPSSYLQCANTPLEIGGDKEIILLSYMNSTHLRPEFSAIAYFRLWSDEISFKQGSLEKVLLSTDIQTEYIRLHNFLSFLLLPLLSFSVSFPYLDDFFASQNVLGLLRSMYVVTILEEDASFLRYGYLSPDNAVVVRKEVVKLCSELRPHALSVVSSFGIPDALLSPIAFDWVDANSWSSI